MIQQTPAKQRGISLIGFVLLGALLLAAGFVAFQAFPAYQESFSVRKVLASTMNKMGDSATPYEIRRQFDLIASADYVDSVRGSDIQVRREGGKLIADVAWVRKIHIVGNAYLLLEFEASSSK